MRKASIKILKAIQRFNRRHPVIAFAVGTTIGFPLEHMLYHYVWPFHLIAERLGL